MATDVIAFSVVTAGAGTNGAPPRGTIHIHDVLRGQLAIGTREASFPPPNDAPWYAIRGGGDAGLAAWKAEPRIGPSPGTALIAVVVPQPDGSLAVEPRAAWPDNDGRRAQVLWGARAAVTIITTPADDLDAFEAMDVDERRRSSGGWKRFPVRSCRLLDTFFMFATHSDLGVFGCAPEHFAGDPLTTCLWPRAQVVDVLPRLEMLVEANADATVGLLREHGGGLADPARIAAALRTGTWPESGDPAEEAAAFAYHLMHHARAAQADRMGVCWEYRGELRAQVSAAPTERTRELETAYARFRGATSDASAAARADLVARLATMAPPEIAAWALAHHAYLGAFLHRCVERGESDTAAAAVARAARAQWAEVRAGARAFVEDNLGKASIEVAIDQRVYRSYFGIDPETFERVE